MARRNQLTDVFKHYDLTGGKDACWPWKGALNNKGIPYFSYRGRSYVAHRVVYHIMHAADFPLDSELLVRHVVCDNGICGNPRHMTLGTHQDNMNDAVSHGRFGLTKEEINAIINLQEQTPDLTHQRIAERVSYQFGRKIGRSTVTDILSGRREERRKGNL